LPVAWGLQEMLHCGEGLPHLPDPLAGLRAVPERMAF
jgi:hypothetical protein